MSRKGKRNKTQKLRDFRKDSCQQLNGIKEDINTINKRMEEAEERIDAAETRIQSWEEVVSGLVKLQVQTEAKLTDLEGRTRREKKPGRKRVFISKRSISVDNVVNVDHDYAP
ncbi:hypothetical protein JOQ06_022283 [Pogonophryne albipinna]|uniref:Uncharacterized protein n=1 Tax=Pogonophryne albipinna TaxID=1090488 RepID=A0AAD6ABX9_9TELE|nr:hypothetical protein JOQ06_022283 [Pogonophryne albipinna]